MLKVICLKITQQNTQILEVTVKKEAKLTCREK